ncbi:unnamed protein product [Zymoseptoria tritici ST99CH_1A5]|uniref:Uncharacterized protein n=1 Tax=Zymoseptoria tritici ST99CH_1A5 TaxID=1276529 RepID=A0A1Y6LRH2_ZYMTR|nr:unnamed protein product [Zymoseptoria tritici ST99CH_1A5]
MSRLILCSNLFKLVPESRDLALGAAYSDSKIRISLVCLVCPGAIINSFWTCQTLFAYPRTAPSIHLIRIKANTTKHNISLNPTSANMKLFIYASTLLALIAPLALAYSEGCATECAGSQLTECCLCCHNPDQCEGPCDN